jgi:hypothetical protein
MASRPSQGRALDAMFRVSLTVKSRSIPGHKRLTTSRPWKPFRLQHVGWDVLTAQIISISGSANKVLKCNELGEHSRQQRCGQSTSPSAMPLATGAEAFYM